jgi:general secretion pathway protein K
MTKDLVSHHFSFSNACTGRAAASVVVATGSAMTPPRAVHRIPPPPPKMRAYSQASTRRSHQQGAALLTALIIVTLVATLASSMVWQQWRATRIEVAERARAQSAWVLSGALDWARLILREDAKARDGGGVDHLGEPWATPLEEARLSTFLAADKNNTDDAPEAFISGRITDAQSRYNLRNVVNEGENTVSTTELPVLRKIFETAGLSVQLADTVAEKARLALMGGGLGAADEKQRSAAPLWPQNVQQLAWLDLTPENIQSLTPYLTVLHERTLVNLNTAPREVLAAVIDGLDLATAERLVEMRKRKPFKTLGAVSEIVGERLPVNEARCSVNSNYFEVRGLLRLSDRSLEEISLVQRKGLEVIQLSRMRVNSRDSAGNSERPQP